MGTFNWDWAAGGPPAEAYSRVTRDLAAVCAEFLAWLDRRPGVLAATYDCSVEVDGPLTTITPADREASPLRIERRDHEGGGTVVLMGFGHHCTDWVSDCLCDACDGDSAEFIEAAERLVDVVTGGFDEFRRRHEEGYLSPSGGAKSLGPKVAGERFEVAWKPWAPRLRALVEVDPDR